MLFIEVNEFSYFAGMPLKLNDDNDDDDDDDDDDTYVSIEDLAPKWQGSADWEHCI